MAKLKTGSRLRSAVCTTEVMVVAAPEADVQVTCGGTPMIDIAATPAEGSKLSPDASKGTALGKRYINQATDLEILCTKAGEGSLGAAGEQLAVKEAKPLPSSD